MDDFFGRAERALLAGDFENARALLVNLVAINPQNDAAWLLLARLTENPKQKEECYARALAINPSNEALVNELSTMNGTVSSTSLPPESVSRQEAWTEARDSFALARQALMLAMVATGHHPEDSIALRMASAAEKTWKHPTEIYTAALDLYDQALRLVPGSRSFMDERKTVALKLERVLMTKAAGAPPSPNGSGQDKNQSLHQAEALARRLYASYGTRQTEPQQKELLLLGSQMLDHLDSAQSFDARVTRARVTTSVIFPLALEVFLDLATQALAKSNAAGDILHWAEERARALDYLLRLEQSADQTQVELDKSQDHVKAKAVLNSVRARHALAHGGNASRQTKLRASELIEFADALIPLLSGDRQNSSLAFGQRLLQILDEVLSLDPARTQKWLRQSGHAALRKYQRTLASRSHAPDGDPTQQMEIAEVERRLAAWLNI